MKKFLSAVTVLALLLVVLAGCQSSQSAQPSDSVSQQPPATEPSAAEPAVTDPAPTEPAVTEPAPAEPAVTDPATKITRDEALKIALEDAGLTKDQIHDLDIDLEKENGVLYFDVDFEVGNLDYDYEIDAESGQILKKEVPAAPTQQATSSSSSGSSSGNSSGTSNRIGKQKARDIALQHAGLSVSQVRDLDVELDRDDGKVHYDVDFEADGYEYDYEIDAETGKILKSHKEKD